MHFTEEDILQIKHKGIPLEVVKQQIECFKTGVPFVNLDAPATVGNGILKLEEKKIQNATSYFEKRINTLESVNFVPASGAATRMFKFLFRFLNEYNPEQERLNAYINRSQLKDLSVFLIGIEKLPFYKLVLKHLTTKGANYHQLPPGKKAFYFINELLSEKGLDFGNYPKGLIPFHHYNNDISTAFEEHLFEKALYTSVKKLAKLHFTISEKHKHKFKKEFERIKKRVETFTGLTFDISYSYQKESTDTIALNIDNTPFRDDNNKLVFRPAGHGALISNLNHIDADLIFIKNIDNVVIKEYKNKVTKYKKVLAGILLEIQEQTFKNLNLLDTMVTEKEIFSIKSFLQQTLNVKVLADFNKYSKHYQIEYLKEQLNKPIRVCGMVKNEGEPGGGPFWVKDLKGNISLQIIESAQINQNDIRQKEILTSSTHFNPVDIVCGVKNYKGEKFNLENYVDTKANFITNKTINGKDIKAQELPGLWNGSMSHWNTIFIEVPLVTFNPVKTVNDLLKPRHQLNQK